MTLTTFPVEQDQTLHSVCYDAYRAHGILEKFAEQKELSFSPSSSSSEAGIEITARYERGLRGAKIISAAVNLFETIDGKNPHAYEHLERVLNSYGGDSTLRLAISDSLEEPDCGLFLQTKMGILTQTNDYDFKTDGNKKHLQLVRALLKIMKIEYMLEDDQISVASEQPVSSNKDQLVELYRFASVRGYNCNFFSSGDHRSASFDNLTVLNPKTGEKEQSYFTSFEIVSKHLDLPLFGAYRPSLTADEINSLQRFTDDTFSCSFTKEDELWEITGCRR